MPSAITPTPTVSPRVQLTARQRACLEQMTRRQTSPQRLVRRAKILLALETGATQCHVMRQMRRKVFFRSAGPDGRRHDLPRRHVEVGDQALRPMAEVFILRALGQTWLHRQGGCGTFQGLSPGFLIRTDDMSPILGHGWCLLIHFTHCSHLGGKRDGVIRLGVEPIFHPMRL